jgi:hypothetical protein
MGGRYRCADTSPTSLIVHLWIYAAHCSIPLVYCTGHKGARALHAAEMLRETGLVSWWVRTVAIVRLALRFVLGADVTGACDVSVTSPLPCARLPHHHVGESHILKNSGIWLEIRRTEERFRTPWKSAIFWRISDVWFVSVTVSLLHEKYRVRQANFLFHMAFHIQTRRLACHTLYKQVYCTNPPFNLSCIVRFYLYSLFWFYLW